MTKRSIVLSVLAAVVTVFAGSYVLRAQAAQTPKNDVQLTIELSKNGSVTASPTLIISDRGNGSITLTDGTEIKINARIITHAGQ